MMTCREVETVIDDWEGGRDVPRDLFVALEAHLDGCTACTARFASLVPLLERDLGRAEFVRMPAVTAAPGVAAVREGRSRSRALRWFAVAAVALFFIGIGVGLVIGRLPRGDSVVVTFTLNAPGAKTVALVGDFNKWNPGGAAMARRAPDGPWVLSLKLPKGHIYTYGFLIDGTRWAVDPDAVEEIQDGFGGSSSILRL